jgi:hypothetical protein
MVYYLDRGFGDFRVWGHSESLADDKGSLLSVQPEGFDQEKVDTSLDGQLPDLSLAFGRKQ